MSVLKIRGIIIRETKSGESDKFITIFAKDIGKISVFAKGASNIKSKFLAGTSIFTYGDFIIRTATKTPTLNSVDIIENFYDITKDLDKYYCGVYLLEFVNKAIADVTDDNRYLILLLKALTSLNSNIIDKMLIVRIFELKMLKYLGYSPYNRYCINCGKENPNYFTLSGLACHNCMDNNGRVRKLNPSTIYTMAYIDSADINELFKFKVNNDVFNELSFIAEKYILYHLECKLKTYEYIKNFSIDNE